MTALTALSTPEQQPMLHRWRTDPTVSTWTAEQIAAQTFAVAEALRPGFEAVIADHIEFGAPVVMEGDFLLPELVAGFGDAVRAVVIAEPDEDRIVANYLAREPHEGPQRVRAQGERVGRHRAVGPRGARRGAGGARVAVVRWARSGGGGTAKVLDQHPHTGTSIRIRSRSAPLLIVCVRWFGRGNGPLRPLPRRVFVGSVDGVKVVDEDVVEAMQRAARAAAVASATLLTSVVTVAAAAEKGI